MIDCIAAMPSEEGTFASAFITKLEKATTLEDHGPAIIAVNPGSLLATKMVKQGIGVAGGDIRKGADILCRAALADEFAAASGQYFDNDSGQFTSPHPDALDPRNSQEIVRVI